MLYVPSIDVYYPFYVQYGSNTLTNVLETYKVVIKTHDYPVAQKAKAPYKNQWKDEHGDDEYIGSNGLYFEAFTFTLECAMFATALTEAQAIVDLNTGIRAFRTFLSSGLFKVYDEWTGFGFKDVRLSEFPMPEQGAYDSWGEGTRVIFKVVLKVNDPATHMVISNNNIVAG
jgi:hypothetical protein